MNPDANEDFIPTSTYEQFLRDREYPEEVIQDLLARKRLKEEV